MMKKDQSKNKSYIRLTIISAIIPIIIIGLVFAAKGIYPTGPNTILIMDMQAQDMPFYASLRYLPEAENSLSFNAYGALGNNFWGTFAYYLTSPLVWLSTLVPLEYLPDYIYALTIFKIGLCGAAFCLYLVRTYYENKHGFVDVLFACCYALMSYNIAYSLNLMWIDGVIILPIILIGIEEIIHDRKPTILIISTFISLWLCYYISFMSAVFCVIYSICRLTELNKWNVKRIIYLFCGAVCGLGLSMPIVLPGILALSQGKMNETFENRNPQLIKYSFVDIIGQLFSGKYDTIYNDGLPFIFCGTITVILVAWSFLKKGNRTHKIIYGLAIAFYFTAMMFEPVDNALHGFRETACFEVRYSYTFSILLLIVAYKASESLSEMENKISHSRVVITLISCFVIAELFMNASIVVAGLMIECHYKPREEYIRILHSKQNLLKLIDDDGFYRISDDNAYSYNDGAWLGYNGIGYFSSCYNLPVMDFLGNLGENQNHHVLKDRNRTPFEESILGLKYRLSYMGSDSLENIIGKDGAYTLSLNEDALPIGFMVKYDPNDVKKGFTRNAFENQNIVACELSGTDNSIFNELELIRYEEVYQEDIARKVRAYVNVPKDSDVWFYAEWADYKDRKEHSVDKGEKSSLRINGDEIGGFLADQSCYLVHMGRFADAETIELEAESTVYFGNIHVAVMDEHVYKEVIDMLKNQQMVLNEHHNGKFSGYIDVDRAGTMLITLPYMLGWEIFVDGIKKECETYRDAMMLLPLSAGKHTIVLEFFTPGMNCSIIICIVTFIISMIWICISSNWRIHSKKSGGSSGVQETEKM